MFGKKIALKEGAHVFSTRKNGDYNDFIFGVITGVFNLLLICVVFANS